MQNHVWLPLTSLLVACLGILGCGDGDGAPCVAVSRREPAPLCDGLTGIACQSDRDCDDQCCREKHCGSEGMCTYGCRSDRDCPVDMLCEHEVCLYACDGDRDCAPGWKCGHGGRVCEAD